MKKTITEYGVYVGEYCKPPVNSDGFVCDVQLHNLPPSSKQTSWHPNEPTTILSKAIEQVEQMGNYKVMMALVDLDKGDRHKEERLYTFTDIESKKLREVIYKEMEKEM